jgi:hypothetical protein
MIAHLTGCVAAVAPDAAVIEVAAPVAAGLTP